MVDPNDVIMIIPTHQEKLLGRLFDNLSGLPYQKVVNISANKLGTNFSTIFDIAKNSRKRYVVTLDDDIEIVSNDTIDRCIEVMTDNNWAMCSTYESYNPAFNPADHNLVTVEKRWLPGYLIVIDMNMMSGYIVDRSLNENEDHIDIDMSMYAHSLGHRMGWSDRAIIHHTDNHLPENHNRGLAQYNMAHGNLRSKWSMKSPFYPDRSVYEAVYVKSENIYSGL